MSKSRTLCCADTKKFKRPIPQRIRPRFVLPLHLSHPLLPTRRRTSPQVRVCPNARRRHPSARSPPQRPRSLKTRRPHLIPLQLPIKSLHLAPLEPLRVPLSASRKILRLPLVVFHRHPASTVRAENPKRVVSASSRRDTPAPHCFCRIPDAAAKGPGQASSAPARS